MDTDDVLVCVFPSVRHSPTVNNVVQAGLNSVIEIMQSFVFLGAGLDIASKLLVEGALTTVVWQVGVDWYRLNSISIRWSVLGSGSNCSSCIVTWSAFWCWWYRDYGIP